MKSLKRWQQGGIVGAFGTGIVVGSLMLGSAGASSDNVPPDPAEVTGPVMHDTAVAESPGDDETSCYISVASTADLSTMTQIDIDSPADGVALGQFPVTETSCDTIPLPPEGP